VIDDGVYPDEEISDEEFVRRFVEVPPLAILKLVDQFAATFKSHV
jgi:hypothetical protein